MNPQKWPSWAKLIAASILTVGVVILPYCAANKNYSPHAHAVFAAFAAVWMLVVGAWNRANPDAPVQESAAKKTETLAKTTLPMSLLWFRMFSIVTFCLCAVTATVGNEACLKQPISPVTEQNILNDEQKACAVAAIIVGAVTAPEIQLLCPAITTLTADVIAALNALVPTTQKALASMSTSALDAAASKFDPAKAQAKLLAFRAATLRDASSSKLDALPAKDSGTDALNLLEAGLSAAQ